MVLDATVGGATANSYMTVDEFFAYLATKPFATELPTPEQCPALLIDGTRLIDGSLSGIDPTIARARGQTVILGWTGVAATDTQALAWPRLGMLTRHGFPLSSDVVPPEVKNCLGEVAYALRTTDLSATDDVTAKGIERVAAGSVSVAFRDPHAAGGPVEPVRRLPDAAYLALVPSWYQRAVDPAAGFDFELI